MLEATFDHQEIRNWAKRHDARPAELPHLDSNQTLLHFIFDDVMKDLEQVRPIDWSTFFAHFDRLKLRFFYDENPSFALVGAAGLLK